MEYYLNLYSTPQISENFPYPLNIHVYKIYMQFWNIIWTHYHDLELVKIKIKDGIKDKYSSETKS